MGLRGLGWRGEYDFRFGGFLRGMGGKRKLGFGKLGNRGIRIR